ncbi:CDK12 kinase, partial [Bombycilla garrulus]|nr:CDK12 kinase [Bombycilla garrulus]
GLGDITQQLNQSELAVLLNLLQSQTDLSVPQMAQLLNVHSNPEMQQQLEALNQSITALTEATAQQQQQQQHEPAAPAAEESAEEPPAELPEEQQTPEAGGAQGDMQNVLAVLLSQLMKSQEPGITLEESNGEKSGEQRGPPRKSPARRPEESTAQELNPAVTAALLQLLSQPDPEPLGLAPHDFGRTYSGDGSEAGFAADELGAGQTLLEPSAQPSGKSRTFLGSVSHLGESSGYQGTGSVQFPGDQDLRFARVPVGIRSFGKAEGGGGNSAKDAALGQPEVKMQSYGELGPGAAAAGGAGAVPGWGAPTSYGKAFRGPGRVPPRGGRGRGVPY